ncbi:uncharacterized protein, partial [Choristoneura fumiferana]|uniref:uncharacterized protein n=1 Tax=Choristoneura fumiferana TaxID=7141 RepID=UPI003D158D54
MDKNHNNKIYDGFGEEISFEYNFVNRPWDDRSKNSKIGIVTLLVVISAVIAVCMVNNFVLHYRGFHPKEFFNKVENSCHLVKRDEYRFVARIHSVASKELLCVGAVLSFSTVLANQVCVKAGPIFLFLGSSFDPRCKKGFSVNVKRTSSIKHGGLVAKKLIIIVSSESLAACGTGINIGLSLKWEHPAYIIGRPLLNTVRSLTKLPVSLDGKGNCSLPQPMIQRVDTTKVICVKDVGRCVVRAGDLLVQNGRLLGIASSSAHRSDIYHTA